jgi:hypothetical protein
LPPRSRHSYAKTGRRSRRAPNSPPPSSCIVPWR